LRALINRLRQSLGASMPVRGGASAPQPVDPVADKFSYLTTIRSRHIDPPVEMADYQTFLDYALDCRGESDYGDDHYLRYCATVRCLTELVPSFAGVTLCETGGLSQVSRFLAMRGAQVTGTEHDLRYPSDLPSDAFDIVLSLEVIEHINDQETDDLHQSAIFRESGVRTYVGEMTRMCRPGGLIVLTTPNPNSLTSLRNLIAGKPPGVFRPHVREYTRDELVALFGGCELMLYRTHSCFTEMDVTDDTIIPEFETLGASSRHRCDDHFLVFRKPA